MLLCLPFTDGALKGHFRSVNLYTPPVSTVVKLLCLQHVTEIGCTPILECEVSFSVRWNDDSYLYMVCIVYTECTFIPTTCSDDVLVHGISLSLQPWEISPNTSPQEWCIFIAYDSLDNVR